MPVSQIDSFKSKKTLQVGSKSYHYFSLPDAAKNGLGDISRLPYSLKVLLENLLRFEDGKSVTKSNISAIQEWLKTGKSTTEIAFRPTRVLMQDFTGVPAVVDLAAMREAIVSLGGKSDSINPLNNVDLVIDHSVMVDEFGNAQAFDKNVEIEFQRNKERYAFLRWGQKAFKKFRVVPPGTGICHQVNLEYLAKTIWSEKDEQSGAQFAFPDTVVGTDSHTTMINGLAVLGWGVGGIEAEAAMLGQPVSMLIPEVIGFKLNGKLPEGITATDLVLTVVNMLRKKGVVDKFVEFYGPGLDHLSLADVATIANMAPEYGATCGFFPISQATIDYLAFSGRTPEEVALVETYAKAQGMWRDSSSPDPVFTDTLELDMSTLVPTLAGPKRPQDKVALDSVKKSFDLDFANLNNNLKVPVKGKDFSIQNGDIVIAAITSCTNTSNPSVLVAAGLVARKARALGLTRKPWVKTSLAPGSQVVTDYLNKAGLSADLDALGFNLVGYGCTTCIGNSGPLPTEVSNAVDSATDLVVCSILSGNRNFEGRISPQVKANYLASPPLVVAYAIAGTMKIDLTKEPLGKSKDGKDVFLKDIWPSNEEVRATVAQNLTREMFVSRYSNVFEGPVQWQKVKTAEGQTYTWDESSTYVKNPPFFAGIKKQPAPLVDIKAARILAKLADSVTTDHISPAGNIKPSSPAGSYLQLHKVPVDDFNSYGSRRGNHEVMMRGTFANIRIRNEIAPGTEGGVTTLFPESKVMPIYDAAMTYQERKTPLVIFAGKEYGTGSSRDWAAKGTALLGVRAVIAESFERIHRSNLIGMGVLPLQFKNQETRNSINLKGDETIDIAGISSLKPGADLDLVITSSAGSRKVTVKCRIDTEDELEYYRNGGILPYVLRQMVEI